MDLFIDDFFDSDYDFNSIKGTLYNNVVDLDVGGLDPTIFREHDNVYSCFYIQEYPEVKEKLEINFITEIKPGEENEIKQVVVHITDTDKSQDHLYHHIISLSPYGIELSTQNFKLSDTAKANNHTSFLTLSDPETASRFEGHPIDSKTYQMRTESEWIKERASSYSEVTDYLNKFDGNATKIWDLVNSGKKSVLQEDVTSSVKY